MESAQSERTLEASRRLHDRLQVLSESARSFAEATTEPQRLLETIVRSVAHVIKDMCSVFLLSDDGALLLPAAVYTSDPAARQLTEAMLSQHPIRLEEEAATRHLLQTGETLLIPQLTPEAGARSAEYAAYLKQLGSHSLLQVPLRLRGESIGLLALNRYRPSSPAFDEHDRELAQLLADHAALALGNSRSYAAERRARAQAEAATVALRESESIHRLLFDESPFPTFVLDAETYQALHANEAALRLYGYTREEFLKLQLSDLRDPHDEPQLAAAFASAGDADTTGAGRHRRKDGQILHVEGKTHLARFAGRPARLAVIHDVTERVQMAEQLRQAQKMEAVGRLAGGVAHDFNNMLSVILSYGDLIRGALKPEDPVRLDVEEIIAAGARAADLTRQLLMFSRRQVLEPKVLDLNALLARLQNMLQRLLGEDVELVLSPDPGLTRVRADPSSIEQLVMNLVVNARDAMPRGGKLTIETANVQLDDAYAREHLGIRPGPHAMLAVSDTGVGMDRSTLARVFEPFFTTKEQGRGTGLGLSTAFGIAQQSGGSIWVYSEPGQGATFKLYLPQVDALMETPAFKSGPLPRGDETILLVEDQEQVRVVARSILRRQGYHVLEARDVHEALRIGREHERPIHLLLSDVVMPQMSGPELARRLLSTRQDTRVLCMSGYTDDSIVRHGVLDAAMPYLQKPITPDTLARKVREVLDTPLPERPPAKRGG